MSFISVHRRKILGGILALDPLWRGFKWIIGRGGDADFIISRIDDPGWIGKIINWLLAPPPWFSGALALAALTLIVWDIMRRNKSKPLHPGNQYKAPKQTGKLNKFKEMQTSSRDDFDIIPQRLIVRGKRSDDGIDVSAFIQYRNRSAKPVTISPIDARFELDGKHPDGKMSGGVSGVISAENTDAISFRAIRLYNERPVGGTVYFSFLFGASKETARTALEISYEFILRSFPENKNVDAVLRLDCKEQFAYYVKATA